jgi:hypothetical protein
VISANIFAALTVLQIEISKSFENKSVENV